MHKILNRSQGFSLIELMIAVAIIGILAAIAIPMYSDYVTSSRRADGQATLMRIAQELERCYTQFSKYNDNSCSVVTGGAVNETSDQGYYTISSSAEDIAKLTESTFVLTATPQNEQTDDTDCAILILTHLGIENATGPDRQGCW